MQLETEFGNDELFTSINFERIRSTSIRSSFVFDDGRWRRERFESIHAAGEDAIGKKQLFPNDPNGSDHADACDGGAMDVGGVSFGAG